MLDFLLYYFLIGGIVAAIPTINALNRLGISAINWSVYTISVVGWPYILYLIIGSIFYSRKEKEND